MTLNCLAFPSKLTFSQSIIEANDCEEALRIEAGEVSKWVWIYFTWCEREERRERRKWERKEENEESEKEERIWNERSVLILNREERVMAPILNVDVLG